MTLFFRYLKKVWPLIGLIILVTILATVFTTARPLAAAGVIEITLDFMDYSQQAPEQKAETETNLFDLNQAGTIVTEYFLGRDNDQSLEESLPYFIAGLLILTFLGGVFKYLSLVINAYARKKVMYQVRVSLVDKLLEMSMEFFDKNKTGEFVSRIITDAKSFGVGIVSVTHHIFTSFFMISIYFTFLFSTDPRLTLAIILILFLHYLISYVLRGPIRRYEEKNFVRAAKLTSRLNEMFSTIRLIKSYSNKNFELSKTAATIDSANQAEYMQSVVGVAEPQARFILDGVVEAIILFIAVLQLFSGALTIEGFLLYIYVARLMLGPLNEISTYYLWVQRIIIAHGRVNEYLSLIPKVRKGSKKITNLKSITFKGVDFSYEDNTVLKNINLELDTDKAIAIVGESGSGKSTMLDLILRFYDVSGGSIMVDDDNIKNLETNSYRSLFGVVNQEVLLLNDSIRNNILYGRELSDEDLEEALNVSNSIEFIQNMPKGIHTIIGERGVKLSGGQRQRLSIARALIGNPKILLFDEATSALDTASEIKVQSAIENVLENKSAIIVAHRLSTIRKVDQIVVMKDKTIEAQGTHAELLQISPTYTELCNYYLEEDETRKPA